MAEKFDHALKCPECEEAIPDPDKDPMVTEAFFYTCSFCGSDLTIVWVDQPRWVAEYSG